MKQRRYCKIMKFLFLFNSFIVQHISSVRPIFNEIFHQTKKLFSVAINDTVVIYFITVIFMSLSLHLVQKRYGKYIEHYFISTVINRNVIIKTV